MIYILELTMLSIICVITDAVAAAGMLEPLTHVVQLEIESFWRLSGKLQIEQIRRCRRQLYPIAAVYPCITDIMQIHLLVIDVGIQVVTVSRLFKMPNSRLCFVCSFNKGSGVVDFGGKVFWR